MHTQCFLSVFPGKVAFFAQNAEVVSDIDVIFRDVITNHGNGYDSNTGSFKAPLGGIYVFNVFYTTYLDDDNDLVMQVNRKAVCIGYANENYDMGVCSAVVQLDQGDVVNVKKVCCTGSRLESSRLRSGFSGFLYSAL